VNATQRFAVFFPRAGTRLVDFTKIWWHTPILDDRSTIKPAS